VGAELEITLDGLGKSGQNGGMIDPTAPAFPQTIDDMGTLRSNSEGLPIRAYMATKIMASLVNSHGVNDDRAWTINKFAEKKKISAEGFLAVLAVGAADALIAELNK
jgi:hypothetical protein